MSQESTLPTPMDEEVAPTSIETEEGSSYNPCPPSDELFDVETTVDPSYIISLIRKLLPDNAVNAVNNLRHPKEGGDDSVEGLEDEDIVNGAAKVDGEALDIKSNCTDQIYGNEETEHYDTSAEDEAIWEEYGCILWDLAADETHANLMAENFLLDVITATLSVSQSLRVTEISLGILGNLACHEIPRNCLVSAKGLVDMIVNQLFLDDSPCLAEACRLLTLGLEGVGNYIFVEALMPEQMLSRILWITENTLNHILLEKSIGLLLAMTEKENVAEILIPPLINLGFPNLLTSLLASELNHICSERTSDRYTILDLILRVLEALSTVKDYSKHLSTDEQLLQHIFELVKLPDKSEVFTSCVTATIIIANILCDKSYLATGISQDLSLLQGLLEIIPLASDDLDARTALWSVLGTVFSQVQEDEMSPLTLHQYLVILVEKSDLIEEDLIDHQQEDSSEDHIGANTTATKSIGRNTFLRKIVDILNQWSTVAFKIAEDDVISETRVDSQQVDKLLQCCHKYSVCQNKKEVIGGEGMI